MIPPLPDGEIGALATRQHGVIATRQLRALGLSTQAISERAAAGRLHRVHHGVYAVGHRVLTGHGRWMAAVLACGPDAALSHASAAALWGIRPSAAERIDVSVPRTRKRIRPGLRIHRPEPSPSPRSRPATASRSRPSQERSSTSPNASAPRASRTCSTRSSAAS